MIESSYCWCYISWPIEPEMKTATEYLFQRSSEEISAARKMNMTGRKEQTDHYGFIKTGKETAEDLLPQSESYDCFSLADEKVFFIEAVSPDSPTQLTDSETSTI